MRVGVLTLSDSKVITSMTIIRSSALLTRCAMGCGGARSRALLPVLSRVIGVARLRLRSMSTVTITTKPKSFAKLHVNSTATGNLKLTLGGPLMTMPAMSTLTCGLCSTRKLVYPVVSTEEGRMCAKVCEFRRRRLVALGRR